MLQPSRSLRRRHLGFSALVSMFIGTLGVSCTHPSTGGGTGSGGSSGVGSGGSNGSGSGGSSGSASGGSSGSGSGGNNGGGGEIILTGSGGDSGSGSGGSGSGSGGNGSGSGGSGSGGAKMSCGDSSYSDAWSPGYSDADHSMYQSMAMSMLGSLSLADKAGQMRGVDPGAGNNYNIFWQPDNSTRGIKGFLFRDGPRAVNMDAPLLAGSAHGRSTVFPVPAARGAAFDMDLEFQIGQAMGDEMVAAGQTLLLAPTVNLLRHPQWGRAQETYGEDTYLLGRLGTASVAGIQQYVPACVKHYAANNIENNRANQDAVMDEQTLREVYGRIYEMIVKDGGVSCIMAAYNKINGTNSTQNRHLLTEILRDDFGFKGFVLSDWWAMPGGNALNSAANSTDNRKARAAEAVKAGMDMELPWAMNYGQLEAITGSGLPLAESDINTSALRILEQKIRFKVGSMSGAVGLKAKAAGTTFSGGSIASADHQALALKAAQESMVLLKNCPMSDKGCTKPAASGNVLPIDKGTVKSIAVVGAKINYGSSINNVGDDPNGGTVDFATSVRLGDVGSSRANADPGNSTGPLAGIMAAAGGGITVTSGNSADAAKDADFVVVVAGLTPFDEGEEYNGSGDRTSLSLDGKMGAGTQDNLIKAVAALGKPMVVVLEGGSVIDTSQWLSMTPALVMAWYPGQDGGTALGQLLFGDKNFGGKLPVTWWANGSQAGTFSAGTSTTMDYYPGYKRADNMNLTPTFPFGHGLSYTSFSYSDLVVPCGDVTKNGVVNVQVSVTNTGAVAGDEVVLLFVSYPESTKRRPKKELKAFYRIKDVAAGTGRKITIPLRIADLKYYDMGSSSWQVETGPVKIMVGPSSANLPLSDTLMIK